METAAPSMGQEKEDPAKALSTEHKSLGQKRNREDDSEAGEIALCGICLAEVDDQGLLDSCQHVYCFDCIMKVRQSQQNVFASVEHHQVKTLLSYFLLGILILGFSELHKSLVVWHGKKAEGWLLQLGSPTLPVKAGGRLLSFLDWWGPFAWSTHNCALLW